MFGDGNTNSEHYDLLITMTALPSNLAKYISALGNSHYEWYSTIRCIDANKSGLRVVAAMIKSPIVRILGG